MPFVDHAAARLHWRADGPADRPALVLGNSLGADLGMWDPLMPALRARFRVVRLDIRGHGKSTLQPATQGSDFSIELLAHDALAVADAAGVACFHYLGLSIGGMVGIWLGRHHSERLQRLVLSNTAARMPSGVWAERIAAVRAGGVATQVGSTMERWFTSAWRQRQENRATLERVQATFLAVDVDGYLGCAAAIRDMDLRGELPHVAVPTLVLTGTFDPSTPSALGRAIADGIRGAQRVELGAAHMPPIEQPENYASAVIRFLDA